MRGRLKARLQFWQSFCTSTLVLTWIAGGLPLLWKDGPPPPLVQRNHASCHEHADFVGTAVRELLATGAAVVASRPPHVVMPLGVVARPGTGKLRLIYDARYVNSFVQIPSFKYETLSKLGQVLRPGWWLFTIDLSAGYHHVDLAESAFPYMGFEWEGKVYHWQQMPFGLAPACWVFTMLVRQLLSKWRREGKANSGYIDDSIHAAPSPAEARSLRAAVVADMAACGFVVNAKKSDPEPSQRKEYLGAVVDTATGALLVPEAKRLRLLGAVRALLECRHCCRIRALEQAVSTITSMSYSFGQLSLLMTRRCVAWITAELGGGNARDRCAPLSAAAAAELEFWLTAFERFDGRVPLWPPTHVHTLIHTDAAGRSRFSFGGWGGWAQVEAQPRRTAAGRWAFDTAPFSSTFLETQAVWLVLQSLNRKGELDGQRILLRTDNKSAAAILNKGASVVPEIQDVCMNLLWYCIERKIDLRADWVPRELNTLADALSKAEESCDWQLNPREFKRLSQLWGPFDIDLFASATNHQLPRYYSYHHTPDCAGVNAFAFKWGKRAWCNPPFAIIARVLDHARTCGARLCLVVPFWPSALWWPRLVSPDPSFFQPFVRACVVLPRTPDLFLGGAYGNSRAQHAPRWEACALLVDFSTAHSRYTTRIPKKLLARPG
jgi:hypothetical protein